MMRLWGFGGGIWDNYGQPSLNTVANANAMANMIQTLNYVKPESMESTIVDTVDDFCNGKTRHAAVLYRNLPRRSASSISGASGSGSGSITSPAAAPPPPAGTLG